MIEHVYIHIPFCTGKCFYCSFVSGKNIQDKDRYLKALIEQIKAEYKGEKIKTLYFGGGTPSLLSVEDIKHLINLFVFEDILSLNFNSCLIGDLKLSYGVDIIMFSTDVFCFKFLYF